MWQVSLCEFHFFFQELAKKGLKPPDNRQTKIECIFECQEHGFSISKEYLERDDREEINFNNQEVGRKVSTSNTASVDLA